MRPDRGKPLRTRLNFIAVAVAVVLVLSGCTAGTSGEPGAGAEKPKPSDQIAKALANVTSVHPSTGMTLLEGPVVGPDGDLYFVDVTAPPGAPKVMALDVGSLEKRTIFTDGTSAVTSAQFSPRDGRLYLTDYLGTIISMTPEGKDQKVFHSGPVNGATLHADDISFDRAGNLYVTDAAGAQEPYWKPQGRLIRIDGTTAEPTVLADRLASPNGVAFTPGFDGLWMSLNTANQIDYIQLTDDGRGVSTAHPAIHVSAGMGQIDSLAVDADGNLYVGFHNRAAIIVFDATGQQKATISIPSKEGEIMSATNIAIKPGTKDAYVTASGKGGGWIHTFTALAEGIPQSNGG